jgi:transcriptional regulator with XRE-family HTH domain
MPPLDVARELARGLKAFRLARGLRQDDVAAAARRAGLDWTRSVVMAFEAGKRFLTVDEFVRIPFLLQALGVPRGEDAVRLANQGSDVAEVEVPALLGQFGREIGLDTKVRALDAQRRQARVALGLRAVPGAGTDAIHQAAQAAGGELEQRLGRRFRLDPVVVALVAVRLWGRSVSEERDQQVRALVTSDSLPRAVTAVRGHITRQLLATLTPRIQEARRRLRGSKGKGDSR